MTSLAERRRRKLRPSPVAPSAPRAPAEPPAWLDDPWEKLKRLPPLDQLHARGLITDEQYSAGCRFAARWRQASLRPLRLVAAYDLGHAGGEHDEEAQQAAREWIKSALKAAGAAAGLLIDICALERPVRLDARSFAALRTALGELG